MESQGPQNGQLDTESLIPEAAAMAALAESAPDGLLLVDAAGRIRLVNHQLEVLSGYAREQLIGEPVELLVPAAARERHEALRDQFGAAAHARIMGEGRTLELQRRDGDRIAVQISLSPFVANGLPLVAAAVRDVRALVEQQQRERMIIEALDVIDDSVVVIDARTRARLYGNRSVNLRTGLSDAELTGIPVGAPATEEDRQRIEAAIDRVTSGTAQDTTVESCVRRAGRDPLPVEIRMTYRPPDDGDGDGDGRIILVARDMTDQIQARRKLETSERSFHEAFDRAPVGMVIAVVDEEGCRTIAAANAALEAMFGARTGELIGRDFAEFTYAEDEATDRLAALAFASHLKSEYQRRKRYRRLDGDEVWVEFRAALVDFPEIAGTTVLAHLLDVTNEHQAQREERRRNDVAVLSADVTQGMLAGEELSRTYQQVVEGISRIFGAENVSLSFPHPRSGQFSVAAAAGPVAEAIARGDLPIDQARLRQLAQQPHAVIEAPPDPAPGWTQVPVGPGCSVRFGLVPAVAGLLIAVRSPGATPFSDDEVRMISGLARQLAMGVQLAGARADQKRLAVMTDRQRIARDLHDNVIQDVLAIGMQLDAESQRSEADPGQRERLGQFTDQLDEVIRRLRNAVFALGERPGSARMTETLDQIRAEAARVLGHHPGLELTGPVDDVPGALQLEISAVLRETLSNVARHSGAAQTAIHLTAGDGQVVLTVDDDGRGLDPSARVGNGIANLQHRARALGGEATVLTRPEGGTRTTFSVPATPTNARHASRRSGRRSAAAGDAP